MHDDNAQKDFESEADGSPVVGDLLKMKFVEHHVVPTILVSLCIREMCMFNLIDEN